VPIFEGRLRFGIQAGQQNTDSPNYLATWRKAEDLGLDWTSCFDHFLPIFSDPEGPCFESQTLLAATAAHTSRLRCGVVVIWVTYRHPAVLANMLHVMGLPRWALAVHARSLRLAAPRWWPGGRPVADRAEGALVRPRASPRDPASRDESCRVRRLYCRTVTEEDL